METITVPRIRPKTAWVIETPNVFEPTKIQRHAVSLGTSISQWVQHRYPQEKEFPVPTICVVNGKPLMRKDWNYRIKNGDVVNFVAVPQGTLVLIIIAVVLIVAAIAVSLLMPMPPRPGEGPESDPVFSNNGKGNTIRLGEPIEVCYGRNRIYPSLASRPFYRYIDNDQFQHSLFCLGQGQFDIEAIQIGDTSIDSYEEVEYEVLGPGETPTLFATNVYTSAEAGGQTLRAPNEPEYTEDGWVGPFSANPAGTEAYKIEFDVTLPKGLYKMNSEGKPQLLSVTIQSQKRLIDSNGNPLGDFTTLHAPVTISAKTVTPQRKTYSVTVDSGRYEVRLRRTDTKNLTAKAGHDVVWESMRAYVDQDQEPDYGDVTLLAVKIRATSNLNNQTQSQFNVIATRKLPIRESGGVFSEPVATRSIVWAFVDIFRSTYGGRLADSFFDWDALEELDALYSSRGEYFDWIFRDAITVWSAAQTVAQVGRAVPLLVGSLITMKRDGPLSVPVALFNQENIVEGSFKWDIKLWDIDEHDSLRVEYTDSTTGYKQEQVTAVLTGGTSDNPEDLRIMGIQNRTHAYRQGMYMLAVNKYLRENISFETGLEGFIPTYGDLIAVSHDVPAWGQSGYVVNAVRGAGTNYHLWLSEPVNFVAGNTYQILLRSRTSAPIGPLTAHATSDPQQVLIQSAADIDFLLDGTTEPMLFLFGVSNNITKYLKVVRVEPQGDEKVRITAVNEDERVHSFDSLVPSALNQLTFPPFPPDLPEISALYITQLDLVLYIVQVSWLSAFGAQYYIIQTSEDGTNWQEQGTTTRTSIQLQVLPGDLYVRVAAVNNGQGPWVQGTISIGHIQSLVVTTPWDLTEWAIAWTAVSGAVSYEVKVYDNTSSSPILKRTETVTTAAYSYDYTKATADSNTVREMLVTVDAMFLDDDGVATASGSPVQLELSNALPEAVSEPIYYTFNTEVGGVRYYIIGWAPPASNAEIGEVQIYLSTTDGFDYTLQSPTSIVSGPDPTYQGTVAIALSGGAHPTQYYRVVTKDVWGAELAVSAQHSILAYP